MRWQALASVRHTSEAEPCRYALCNVQCKLRHELCLGVEAHETRSDLYARSMRKPLSKYVENLDEVREALRGTPWAADPVLTTA